MCLKQLAMHRVELNGKESDDPFVKAGVTTTLFRYLLA